MPVSEEGQQNTVNYQQKYKTLKRKLKFLIYEHECFQEELHKAQRKLLKISRDKSFLLDRLLQYEKIEDSTTDSEATASSDSEIEIQKEGTPSKKKKIVPASLMDPSNLNMLGTIGYPLVPKQSVIESAHIINETPKKRSKSSTKSSKQPSVSKMKTHGISSTLAHGDGHMTSEEIEKHLESRQQLIDLLPEKAPPTVPKELFSNEPSTSLDSEPNEATGGDSSPSNFEDSYADDDSLFMAVEEWQVWNSRSKDRVSSSVISGVRTSYELQQ